MKTKLMTTSIIALLLGLYPPCTASSWQVIYQTDFSSDPYWMTSRPTHYFWDPSDTTYYIDQENINYGGNYAVIETGYAGGSFRLQYDIQMLSTNYAGGVSFGLYDPDLNSNNTGSYAEVHFVREDRGHVVFLEARNQNNTYTGAVSVSPQFVIGTWYRVLMEYDAGNRTLMLFVTKRENGATHAYMTISGVGPFASDMGLLGNSNIRDYTFQVPGAHCTAKIDNVTLSVMQGDANKYKYSDYTWLEYNGHLYAITLEHSNWAQAEAWANEVGGHLVQVDDMEENAWLSSTFKGYYAQSDPGNPWSSYVWIGLEYIGGDMKDRSSWQWSTGEPLAFNPRWWINPNNYNGIHVYLHTDTHPNPGTWLNYEVQDISPEAYPKGIIEIDEQECPDPPSHEPWSFVQITDLHIGYEDPEEHEYADESVIAAVYEICHLSPQPRFVLVTGDIADRGCNQNDTCDNTGHYDRFNLIMDLLDIDYYPIPGNHDRKRGLAYRTICGNGLGCYQSNVTRPDDTTFLTRSGGPGNYWFEVEDSGFVFVGLDTGPNNLAAGDHPTDDQIADLIDLGNMNRCKPKVLFMHHPAAGAPGQELAHDRNKERFMDWCDTNNVKAVITGHTHQDVVCDRYGFGSVPGEVLCIQTPACGESSLTGDPKGYRVYDVVWGHAVLAREVNGIQDTLDEMERARAHSPVELHAYNSQGDHVGINPSGGIDHAIHGSYYLPHYSVETEGGSKVYPQKILTFHPSDNYLYELIGTEEGTYRLDITSVKGGEEIIFEATDIPTSAGARHVYSVDWNALSVGEDGVILEIDADGDGIFEKSVVANEDLTSQEFALQTKTVIDFEPDTLNLRSPGKLITVFIELPESFDVSNIDVSTLNLNDTVYALLKPVAVDDYDSDGIPDLMVKFDRQQVIGVLGSGTQMVTLTGRLSDGRPLVGIDFIRVIDGESIELAKSEVELITPERFTTDLEENLKTTEDDKSHKGEDEILDVKEAAAFMLFEISDTISELGPENFRNEELGIELASEIENIFITLDKELLIEALDVIKIDVLQRMDGCANIGHLDKDDWVTSIEGQALLYPLVVDTIELLESML